MQSDHELAIPEVLPVMTLRGMVLFPHAVVPLYIFEERYRTMLRDVLTDHRMFAIFKEDPDSTDCEEPPHTFGSVGVIRAAHQNPDGTSNVALQGLARVRMVQILGEDPYRTIRVEACPTPEPNAPTGPLRQRILTLLDQSTQLTNDLPAEYLAFLRNLTEPEPFLDVAIQAVCQTPEIKQRLLETLDLEDRFLTFEQYLIKEKRRDDLLRQLQGNTRDDEIELN